MGVQLSQGHEVETKWAAQKRNGGTDRNRTCNSCLGNSRYIHLTTAPFGNESDSNRGILQEGFPLKLHPRGGNSGVEH